MEAGHAADDRELSGRGPRVATTRRSWESCSASKLELRRRAGDHPAPAEYAGPLSASMPRSSKPFSAPRSDRSAVRGPRHDLPTIAPGYHRRPMATHGEPAPGHRVRYFGDYEIDQRAGPRRHGRRLPRPADQPQPPRRPQDDSGRPARRRDRRQALLHRGRGCGQARPPGDRADLRGRPARGAAFLLDGLRRGAEPGPAAGRRTDARPRGGGAACSRWPGRSSTRTAAA